MFAGGCQRSSTDSRGLLGSAGLCNVLLRSTGVCRGLLGSVEVFGVCRELMGSAGIG